ncbi:MAG: hypothetical protein D8B59_10275 [Bacteroidetes bacterium]|nr:MAG: hypothetical protein D8B59_10275 [Bacteroidota bacterium]
MFVSIILECYYSYSLPLLSYTINEVLTDNDFRLIIKQIYIAIFIDRQKKRVTRTGQLYFFVYMLFITI